MWGLIYGAAFTGVFLLSAIIKMTYDPLGTRVDWSGAVGAVYTDLSYGEGPANKFDLYLPADDTKEAYGLVVYLHAGGFTAGDKSDDAEILKWLCSRGYAAEVRDISADVWVNEHSVPTLCVYGTHDRICPFPAVRPLLVALEKNGVPYDCIEYPHSGHGLQNDGRQARLYQEKIVEYLEWYLG